MEVSAWGLDEFGSMDFAAEVTFPTARSTELRTAASTSIVSDGIFTIWSRPYISELNDAQKILHKKERNQTITKVKQEAVKEGKTKIINLEKH